MATDLKEVRTLDLISEEAANRPIRRRKLEIVPYKPTKPQSNLPLALEGTVTLLVARRGSALMAEIREALATGKNTEAVARKLYLQYKKRKQVTLARAVKTVVAQPVFADVLYGDVMLQEALFVPAGMEVAFLPFPYNGGPLAEAGLTVVEHPVSEDVEPLDIIALQNVPELTPAERAALLHVAEDQAVLNLGFGPGPRACGTGLLVAAVVVEVAVVAVTFAITGSIDLLHMQALSDEEVQALGPAKTARTLVAMRRKLLETSPARKKSAPSGRRGR